MTEILVLNAGSSSLKFALFAVERGKLRRLFGGQVADIGAYARLDATAFDIEAPDTVSLGAGAGHGEALEAVLGFLEGRGIVIEKLAATGHRIVHGGRRFTEPQRSDAGLVEALKGLERLAPLHMPYGTDLLARLSERLPSVPHIACFDTAFHAGQPEIASRFALPSRYNEMGYRRYGFHGLNYEHIVHILPDQTGLALPGRLLIAHLGAGASMAAVKNGIGVATTMGYSTIDGLVMSTRSGAIDPGVIVALMRDEGLDADQLEVLLYRESGLAGLSGVSGDMKRLLEDGSPAAQMAIDHYCYWAARNAGSLVTAMGGLDAMVFTGGVGENAAAVRAGIAEHLAYLGIAIDPERNARNQATISAEAAKVPVWIVEADEELTIARHAIRLTANQSPAGQ